MGTEPPKSEDDPGKGRIADLLEELEDAVKDAILTTTDDPILSILLEITLNSLVTHRPLFDNPLEEPIFYRRHFVKWVEEGLQERAKTEEK